MCVPVRRMRTTVPWSHPHYWSRSTFVLCIYIALRWSAEIGPITILFTLHSAGVQEVENLYQVTLAQIQSQSEKRVSIYGARHTLRTSGARESGHVTFNQHVDPLDRGKGLRLESVTC